MKPRSEKSLAVLTRLKEREEQTAAQRMAAARDKLEQERRTLSTVQQYLDDYANRPAPGAGSSRLLAEARRFWLQLESSISTQQDIVAQAERQAELAKAHWTALRAERQAIGKLVENAQSFLARQRQGGEQRQLDEHAAQQRGLPGGALKP